MPESPQWLRANVPQIAAEDIDGEVVVVSFETGHYYSLRDTAADIWRLLERGVSKQAVVEVFEESAGPAVEEFMSSLQAEGLLVVAEANGDPDPRAIQLGRFTSPKLERFEEMSEMLLYDPIHDVDSAGWPNLPIDDE